MAEPKTAQRGRKGKGKGKGKVFTYGPVRWANKPSTPTPAPLAPAEAEVARPDIVTSAPLLSRYPATSAPGTRRKHSGPRAKFEPFFDPLVTPAKVQRVAKAIAKFDRTELAEMAGVTYRSVLSALQGEKTPGEKVLRGLVRALGGIEGGTGGGVGLDDLEGFFAHIRAQRAVFFEVLEKAELKKKTKEK